MEEKPEKELILKAEFYRQLSEFDKAINLLKDKKISKEDNSWGELLMDLALKKDNELKEKTDIKIKYPWER